MRTNYAHCNVRTGEHSTRRDGGPEITLPQFKAALHPSDALDMAKSLLTACFAAGVDSVTIAESMSQALFNAGQVAAATAFNASVTPCVS